jgi:GTP-binding protein
MFDILNIKVIAGKGGDGAIAFRREKFVPFGGPDGGDGGKGGDIILVADESVTNFKTFPNYSIFKAMPGVNGHGKKMYGKNGENYFLKLPVGTMVYEVVEDGEKVFLADLEKPGDALTIASGGRGGWGNLHYAAPTNQAPRLAQRGENGEEKNLWLEVRTIADIGIIGYPNVGKSSLLAAASAAKPQIADYPFTTKEPQLGIVDFGNDTMALAEIPGLIEGASQGKGLGYDFLRHSTRTHAFIHLVDGSSVSPAEDMVKVNNELALYDPALSHKPQIVVVNKIDKPEVQARKSQIQSDFEVVGVQPLFISAATGEGVKDLMQAAYKLLKKTPVTDIKTLKVFHPQPKKQWNTVTKENNTYVINNQDIERIIRRIDMQDDAVLWQLRGFLDRKGIGKMLEKAGIQGGDKVRCGSIEWEW